MESKENQIKENKTIENKIKENKIKENKIIENKIIENKIIENKKIRKVTEPILYLPQVHSIGVIGDPGCEGLGTYNMKVYAGTLAQAAKDDLILIAGDLVPTGTDYYYRQIEEMTDIIAEKDVYVLRGNHDTGAYEKYFGKKNYALIMEKFALVVLDNAMRSFEEEGLRLLEEVLDRKEVEQVIISFHIPVPNHFIPNSVSEEEFEKLKKAYRKQKQKVAYLVCGHVHSRFIDQVDGITLICTGGGGAMIEDVSEDIKASDVEHHMVHFKEEGGKLSYQVEDLSENRYNAEGKNSILKDKFKETVTAELMAHLKYTMFADRAGRRGLLRLEALFRALAASEYYHARNFYSVIEQDGPFSESIGTYIPAEEFEYQRFYKMMEDFARENRSPLAEQAYEGASAAEKVHADLLKKAESMEDSALGKVYVCPICGFVMAGDKIPERCPVCGGPKRQFETF